MTTGMAYEAMNNAAYINSRMLVILNDNGQVSLPTGTVTAGGVVPAGALSGYTSRLLTSSTFKSVRDIAKGLNRFLPGDIQVHKNSVYCMCSDYNSFSQQVYIVMTDYFVCLFVTDAEYQ